jgi:hypothetical protein
MAPEDNAFRGLLVMEMELASNVPGSTAAAVKTD